VVEQMTPQSCSTPEVWVGPQQLATKNIPDRRIASRSLVQFPPLLTRATQGHIEHAFGRNTISPAILRLGLEVENHRFIVPDGGQKTDGPRKSPLNQGRR